ncbi:hypothetical protein COCON_G00201240 [Conger conger]|uniref:Uncharacterized protein n=1 Tax=Conger conger TaxID=82655 RepID=A0A9Q1CZE7_CONCO|nr:hypothetical protein COCON_G00201240 [Conger conger]
MVKTQQIDDDNLETDTEYTAVVCSFVRDNQQKQCSEWSPPVNWRSKSKPDVLAVRDWEKITFLWNIVLPMCVIAGILLCFFFSPTVRLKIKVWSVIPTPAPYFQPLFTSYKGNFRSWLVSQGGPEEPLKMEDVQEIDRVREAQPLQGEESCPPAPAPHSCPTPYVTPGDDGWCMGSPAPSPTLRDPPDTLLPLSLLKVCLAEIFGSQSLGLVLAVPNNELVPGILKPSTLTDSHNELVPKTLI